MRDVAILSLQKLGLKVQDGACNLTREAEREIDPSLPYMSSASSLGLPELVFPQRFSLKTELPALFKLAI